MVEYEHWQNNKPNIGRWAVGCNLVVLKMACSQSGCKIQVPVSTTPVRAIQGACTYTQSSVLSSVNLRNHWQGGARKRINQKGSEPENAIILGDFP
jgi:hypothetical protein